MYTSGATRGIVMTAKGHRKISKARLAFFVVGRSTASTRRSASVRRTASTTRPGIVTSTSVSVSPKLRSGLCFGDLAVCGFAIFPFTAAQRRRRNFFWMSIFSLLGDALLEPCLAAVGGVEIADVGVLPEGIEDRFGGEAGSEPLLPWSYFVRRSVRSVQGNSSSLTFLVRKSTMSFWVAVASCPSR